MPRDRGPAASWFETPRLRPLGFGGLLTMRVWQTSS